MTVAEIYQQTVRQLPVADRLELASLILSNIPRNAVVDDRGDWTSEDYEDFTRSGRAHIEKALDDENS